MRITFAGAAGGVVTGSCFVVEHRDKRFLVDCGMFQGSKELANRNYGPFPFDPRSIDAVFLTHAHIDHSGLLPKLVRLGFDGPIYATPPTSDLLEIMLPDSAHIQETEVARKNRNAIRKGEPLITPIYTTEDAIKTCKLVQKVEPRTHFEPCEGLHVSYWPAGHMLGAASIVFDAAQDRGRVRVAFSGDLGGDGQALIVDPSEIPPPDYVVMESTYGDRTREKGEDRFERLGQIVRETFARGGNVIIPAFAIGRAQEVLYGLHRLIKRGDINPKQIFLDSPLAIEATEIFCNHIDRFDEEARRFAEMTEYCPLYMRELALTRTPEESMAINRIKSGAVILSASGMCEAGRIKHHLKHNLWRENCSVVFVGYQAVGTLGRRILDGEPIVRIHGEPVKVRARIHSLDGFSAHGDQRELLDWAAKINPSPRAFYLVHGEEPARKAFAALLREKLNATVYLPTLDEEVELTQARAARIAPGTTVTDGEAAARLWEASERLRASLNRLEREAVSPDEIDALIKAIERSREMADALIAKG